MNCIIIDDDEISRSTIKQCLKKANLIEFKAEFNNATDAISYLNQESIDVIFLDVEMPEMSGIDFIRSYPDLPQIILVTSQSKYAVDGFDFNVTDFLLKPIDYARFIKACNNAIKVHESLRVSNIETKDFFIKQDTRLIRLNANEVIYIEALADYVNIYTEDTRYVVLSTMKAIENKLSKLGFVRTHRSFIVNSNKIKEIEDNSVSIGGKTFPISRSFKDSFLKKLNLI